MKGIRDEGWKDCECGHGLLIVPLVMHFTAPWFIIIHAVTSASTNSRVRGATIRSC
jgi:hypothetical protein